MTVEDSSDEGDTGTVVERSLILVAADGTVTLDYTVPANHTLGPCDDYDVAYWTQCWQDDTLNDGTVIVEFTKVFIKDLTKDTVAIQRHSNVDGSDYTVVGTESPCPDLEAIYSVPQEICVENPADTFTTQLQRQRQIVGADGTITSTVTEYSADGAAWSTTLPTGTITIGACPVREISWSQCWQDDTLNDGTVIVEFTKVFIKDLVTDTVTVQRHSNVDGSAYTVLGTESPCPDDEYVTEQVEFCAVADSPADYPNLGDPVGTAYQIGDRIVAEFAVNVHDATNPTIGAYKNLSNGTYPQPFYYAVNGTDLIGTFPDPADFGDCPDPAAVSWEQCWQDDTLNDGTVIVEFTKVFIKDLVTDTVTVQRHSDVDGSDYTVLGTESPCVRYDYWTEILCEVVEPIQDVGFIRSNGRTSEPNAFRNLPQGFGGGIGATAANARINPTEMLFVQGTISFPYAWSLIDVTNETVASSGTVSYEDINGVPVSGASGQYQAQVTRGGEWYNGEWYLMTMDGLNSGPTDRDSVFIWRFNPATGVMRVVSDLPRPLNGDGSQSSLVDSMAILDDGTLLLGGTDRFTQEAVLHRADALVGGTSLTEVARYGGFTGEPRWYGLASSPDGNNLWVGIGDAGGFPTTVDLYSSAGVLIENVYTGLPIYSSMDSATWIEQEGSTTRFQRRYTRDSNGVVAFVDYDFDGNVITITGTVVECPNIQYDTERDPVCYSTDGGGTTFDGYLVVQHSSEDGTEIARWIEDTSGVIVASAEIVPCVVDASDRELICYVTTAQPSPQQAWARHDDSLVGATGVNIDSVGGIAYFTATNPAAPLDLTQAGFAFVDCDSQSISWEECFYDDTLGDGTVRVKFKRVFIKDLVTDTVTTQNHNPETGADYTVIGTAIPCLDPLDPSWTQCMQEVTFGTDASEMTRTSQGWTIVSPTQITANYLSNSGTTHVVTVTTTGSFPGATGQPAVSHFATGASGFQNETLTVTVVPPIPNATQFAIAAGDMDAPNEGIGFFSLGEPTSVTAGFAKTVGGGFNNFWQNTLPGEAPNADFVFALDGSDFSGMTFQLRQALLLGTLLDFTIYNTDSTETAKEFRRVFFKDRATETISFQDHELLDGSDYIQAPNTQIRPCPNTDWANIGEGCYIDVNQEGGFSQEFAYDFNDGEFAPGATTASNEVSYCGELGSATSLFTVLNIASVSSTFLRNLTTGEMALIVKSTPTAIVRWDLTGAGTVSVVGPVSLTMRLPAGNTVNFSTAPNTQVGTGGTWNGGTNTWTSTNLSAEVTFTWNTWPSFVNTNIVGSDAAVYFVDYSFTGAFSGGGVRTFVLQQDNTSGAVRRIDPETGNEIFGGCVIACSATQSEATVALNAATITALNPPNVTLALTSGTTSPIPTGAQSVIVRKTNGTGTITVAGQAFTANNSTINFAATKGSVLPAITITSAGGGTYTWSRLA
jgi:hypothetical protein